MPKDSEKPVDENGYPTIMDENNTSAAYCPEEPCISCTGLSAELESYDEDNNPIYKTSWKWCQEMNTCSATIDWELISEGR